MLLYKEVFLSDNQNLISTLISEMILSSRWFSGKEQENIKTKCFKNMYIQTVEV